MNSVKDLVGEAHYFDETVNAEKIKHLLDNVDVGSGKASTLEKTEGMKYLLAQMARGRDVSEFYPDVVRNVIVKAVEVKKLVYMYLVHHADANPTCRELALLAINSFQRDLSDPNQLIRALALRVLCSIRVREIVQIQLMSVKKCGSDNSPYVRKTAAHSVGKIFQIDPDAKGELVEVLERLLGDKSTAVLSSAVAAFNEVCPEQLELLHVHYRPLCHMLADLDEWGQITAMTVLMRYARASFAAPPAPEEKKKKAAAKPKKESSKKKSGKDKKKGKKSAFYSESEDESEEEEEEDEDDSEDSEDSLTGPKLPEDHELLLRVTLPLLRSRNSGVVLAVASVHLYIGAGDKAALNKIGRALVRVMRNYREIQFVVLSNIVEFARLAPDMFRKYIKDFYIAEGEPAFVRNMKLDVLAALVSAENSGSILREFTRYVKDDDKGFVRHAIQCIVRIANALPEIADRCLRGLMALATTESEVVVAEAVIAIRQLLQQHPQHDFLVTRLAKRLAITQSPSARAAIVWILGEFQSKPRVAAMAPDSLRVLAKGFRGEATEVKYQILNLAAKTALWHPDSKPVSLLLKYILELARYDADYDLRDRARTLRAFMLGTEITAIDAEALEAAGEVIAVGAGTEAGVAGFGDAEATAAEVADGAGAPSGEEVEAGGEGPEGGASTGAGAAAAEAGGAPPGSNGRPASGSSVASASPSAGAPPAGSAAVAGTLRDRCKAVLLAAKPPPAIESALAAKGSGPDLALGSMSFMVGHSARGYIPLPPWAAVGSNPSLRDPPKEEEPRSKSKAKAGKKAAKADSSDDSEEDEEDSSEEDSSSEEEESEEESEEEESEEEAAPRKGKAAKKPAPPDSEEEEEDESEEEDDEDEDSD